VTSESTPSPIELSDNDVRWAGCQRTAIVGALGEREVTDGSRWNIWHTAVVTAAWYAASMTSSDSVGMRTTALRRPVRSVTAMLT
jgi:hypothetical protein